MKTRIAFVGGAFPLAVVLGDVALAQPFADAAVSQSRYSGGDRRPALECAALAQAQLPDLVQLEARTIAAEGAVPEHCRLNGVLAPEVAFEVNLPAQWNGRLYMIGNGGHAGEAPDDPGRAAQRGQALGHGFVMASTNTGHYARGEPSATFVLSNPQKAIDYAYRAVHLTAVAAKSIASRYYGNDVAYSYWNSCSNGGRQGLLEAQRYPTDFDGIVANAPWVDQTGFTIGALWNQRVLAETSLTAEKLGLVAEHVMRVCDAVDGLADGLIDDPRQCKFDVAADVPACASGDASATCLTADEAAAVQKIYDGPRDSAGGALFPGFMLGSEALVARPDGSRTSGWLGLIVPPAPDARAADFGLAEGTMRYLVPLAPEPDWDFRTFDFDRDPPLLERWGRLADATDPYLGEFRADGGKLILTYGWADAILQPLMGVDYYERALAANGGQSATDFVRLFMLPGMAHCAGGNGPDQYDAVTAVIDWVEKDVAPDTLVASKVAADGTITRSRPLCPYPQVARYRGEGSVDDAASFACVTP